MKQVFFITDDVMTVMLWQGPKLIAKYEFKQDEESLAKLSDYLEESCNIEASVIVDVLEEEVTLATIPHASPRDRKFLIERTKTRLFRSATFCTANIIGREDNPRRDDRLLVSGLTNDRVLLKWLDVFNSSGLLVKGIYSLPLISGHVLKMLGMKKGLTLLVSRQSRDFIRQSIFKDGKLFYSRNIPSSQNFNIETITADLEKTKKYLQNQKLLSMDDRINVVVLSSERFYQQLNGLDELLPDMDITYVKHESLQSSLDIKSDFKIGGKEIFSMLLLKSITKNHYGRAEDLVQYKNKSKNDVFNFMSVAVAVVFVMMSIKLYLDTEVLENNLNGLEEQVSSLKQQNNKMEKTIAALPVKVQKMKTFVDNMSDLDKASKVSIKVSLAQLSRVFQSYSNISLRAINWYLSSQLSNQRKRSNRSSRNKKVTPSKSSGQRIEITAQVDLATLGNQQAKKAIDRFVASLSKVSSVKTVQLVNKPLNDSSKEKLSGEISDNKKKVAEFSLTVMLKESEYAG